MKPPRKRKNLDNFIPTVFRRELSEKEKIRPRFRELWEKPKSDGWGQNYASRLFIATVLIHRLEKWNDASRQSSKDA